MPGRNILIAVDASEHSRAAFDWFLKNVYQSGDSLIICHIPELPSLPLLSIRRFLLNVYKAEDTVIVCHILEQPNLPLLSMKDGLSLPVEQWQKAIQDQIDKVKQLETDYEMDLVSKKIHYKFKEEQYHSPGEGIIATSEAEDADMIVVGTRGLDVVRRTLLGSVSDYVVRHSHIPVLVCPLKKHK